MKPDAEDFVECLTNVNADDDRPPNKLARLHLPLYDSTVEDCNQSSSTATIGRPTVEDYSQSSSTATIGTIENCSQSSSTITTN